MGEGEHGASQAGDRRFSGKDRLYRERGVSALDVQRAADALLREGQKPSVAAVREYLGGGSPNTVSPLLDQYWRGLGTRIPAGPEALERVPESLARMTEELWLRSLDEARERAKALHRAAPPAQHALAALDALEQKVTELTAALAEARARMGERESELLGSLRERQDLKEQVRRLTALLESEQELRAQDRQSLDLARRRLTARVNRKAAIPATRSVARKPVPKKRKPARTRTSKRSRRQPQLLDPPALMKSTKARRGPGSKRRPG